eukprot:TRINITY_DN59390_c0_g1_i1.p1 TRINITY_DN59390_c0_g1~~TRINITY_DN59390_c0_g1_i1.p1  ORF type:complete len:299 (+),score=34.49 TRINITY_DN59390_c0_g1_i1:65-898(+)
MWALTFATRAEIHQAMQPFPGIDDTMLALGDKGQPLLPGLVVPAGYTYKFGILENRSLLERNDYRFVVRKVCQGNMCEKLDAEPFMYTVGGWTSNQVGHRTVKVQDRSGKHIFTVRSIRSAAAMPFSRCSYRVFPPNSTDKSDVLFTIFRDAFGQGLLWKKDEWRVYRGRKRDNDQIYFGINGYFDTWSKTELYKIPGSDYKKHPDKHIGTLQKKLNGVTVVGDIYDAGDWIGDNFKLEVKEGEDSGVLLMLGMVVDMWADYLERMERINDGIQAMT